MITRKKNKQDNAKAKAIPLQNNCKDELLYSYFVLK